MVDSILGSVVDLFKFHLLFPSAGVGFVFSFT
jgi:hypothetical protein